MMNARSAFGGGQKKVIRFKSGLLLLNKKLHFARESGRRPTTRLKSLSARTPTLRVKYCSRVVPLRRSSTPLLERDFRF